MHGPNPRDGRAPCAPSASSSTRAWTPSMANRRVAPTPSRRSANSSTMAATRYRPCSWRCPPAYRCASDSIRNGCSFRYIVYYYFNSYIYHFICSTSVLLRDDAVLLCPLADVRFGHAAIRSDRCDRGPVHDHGHSHDIGNFRAEYLVNSGMCAWWLVLGKLG